MKCRKYVSQEASMGVTNAFRISVRIPAKTDIKISVKEIGCEDVYWIYWLRVRSHSGIL